MKIVVYGVCWTVYLFLMRLWWNIPRFIEVAPLIFVRNRLWIITRVPMLLAAPFLLYLPVYYGLKGKGNVNH